MQTKGLLDWPLPFALFAIVVIILFVFIALQMLLGVIGLIASLARENRKRDQVTQATYRQIPTDPRERLEWANRTGRYAPGADKSE